MCVWPAQTETPVTRNKASAQIEESAGVQWLKLFSESQASDIQATVATTCKIPIIISKLPANRNQCN